MHALAFRGKQAVHFEEVPDPELQAPGDVIVRVDLAAICGSDLHVYHERERGIDPGTVMGHEFVGEIVEVGHGVRGFGTGARVLSPFSTSCGGCFYCQSGLTARCPSGQLFGWVQRGSGLQGTQAEYLRVPLADSTLVAIPPGVTDEEALLLGDVFSTGYFCARMAGVNAGGTYAIVGCGPVGLMAILGARELEAESLFAIDTVPERLALAVRFGARAVNLAAEDPVGVVREATGGRGADAVLELVGSAEAGRLAIDLVRPGGTLAVAGVHNEERFPFSPAEAYAKNLTFRTGRCPARATLDHLLPVVQRKKYDLAAVLTHRMPLSQGETAYATFDRKLDGCIKVALTP